MAICSDYAALMGLDGRGGDAMRALAPMSQSAAVRRAHAAIHRQLRAHAGADDTALELGSVSTTENSVDLNGVMFDVFKPMKKALSAYKGEVINLRIHSGGGDAFEGSAMYNLLRQDGRKVVTTSMGLAASAASLVFMAGDERIVGKGAMLMIHDVWSCGMGNAEELRQVAAELDVASDAIAELYAERAGGSVSEWRERMAVDTFLGGDEAVELGLATGRTTPVAAPRKKTAATDGKGKSGKADAKAVRAQAPVAPAVPAEPTARHVRTWDGRLIRTT